MYYGHQPHVSSPEDMTVHYCRCGWHSEEMTRQQVRNLGVPWYCGGCGSGGSSISWIKFHPSERAAAYEAAHLPLPTI